MGVYSVTGDLIPIQIIDTRELPENENIWLGKLDNRLDRNGARKIIDAIDRLDKAARMGAYVDAIYNANFKIMEWVVPPAHTTQRQAPVVIASACRREAIHAMRLDKQRAATLKHGGGAEG
ncbi:MAG: hypothetical protein LBF83_05140 [Spirochaetaceae bacterium]|jgi:hypothetical protein|nr:hypothetical protein [Spirochaetaceae bacterium]